MNRPPYLLADGKTISPEWIARYQFSAVSKCGKYKHKYLPAPKQLDFHESTILNVIMEGRRGTGKAILPSTPVPTPEGLKTMGELQVGDRVFDEHGQPCSVTWKSELHVDPSGTYRVTFDDGSEIVCGGNHEWYTITRSERIKSLKYPGWRRRKGPRPSLRGTPSWGVGSVKTTHEISATVKTPNGRETNHRIPLAGAWELPEVELPIDPYVLGVWLGDGSKYGGSVTSADLDVMLEIADVGYDVRKHKAQYQWSVIGLTTQLKALGVYLNKHIPDTYLFASVRQRLALLQGLMDTDGTCDIQSSCQFDNTNGELAYGVYRLVASLGLKPTWQGKVARLHGKDCGLVYRIHWTSSLPVFRLKRKLDRLPLCTRPTQHCRYILSVERVDQEDVQCIEVDSPSHLYLAGLAGIPTHNSVCQRNDAHMRALAFPGFVYLIARRTMGELEKTHLKFIVREMKAFDGDFNLTKKIAYYPNGSLGFYSSCNTEEEMLKLLGGEYHAIYLDEITTFTGEQIGKIGTCLRVPEDPASGLPTILARMRGGTNPIGEGADWVFAHFITKDVDPLVEPDYIPDDYLAIHLDAVDNIYIEPEKYDKQFSHVPEHIRRAWKNGEWIVEGAYFNDYRPALDGKPWHVIPALPRVDVGGEQRSFYDCLPWLLTYRAVDWGWDPDPACCVWITVLPNGREIAWKEQTWRATTASQVARQIETGSAGMRVAESFADPVMFANQQATDFHSIADIFAENGVSLTKSRNDRAAAGFAIHEHLNTLLDDGFPKFQIYAPACPQLIKTFPMMRIDKNDPTKIANGPDHHVISVGYYCQGRIGLSDTPNATLVPWWLQTEPNRFTLGRESVRR